MRTVYWGPAPWTPWSARPPRPAGPPRAFIWLGPGLIGLGLELAVPPLSLLVAGWLVLLAVCLLWWQVAGGSWAPAVTLVSAAMLAGGAVFGGWVKYGRRMLPLTTLLAAPVYV